MMKQLFFILDLLLILLDLIQKAINVDFSIKQRVHLNTTKATFGKLEYNLLTFLQLTNVFISHAF